MGKRQTAHAGRGEGHRHRRRHRFRMQINLWKEYLDSKYSIGDGLRVVPLEKLPADREHESGPITFLAGGSLSSDMALMKGLASLYEDCSYFEIGTVRCESLANMAHVAKECYVLNLSSGDIKKMGVRNSYLYSLGYYSMPMDNVVYLKGTSQDFDYSKLNKKFDIIFIDGYHHYDQVKYDTQQAFAWLVHESSIVVWHDYTFQSGKIRYEVLAGILDGTDPGLHKQFFHASATKCAIFSPGKEF